MLSLTPSIMTSKSRHVLQYSTVAVIGPAVYNNLYGSYGGTTATVDPVTGKVNITNVKTEIITTEDIRFGVSQWLVRVTKMLGKFPAVDLTINGAGGNRSGDTGSWQAAWAYSLNGPWFKFDTMTNMTTHMELRHNTASTQDEIYIAGIPMIVQSTWENLIAGWIANPLVSKTNSGDANWEVGTYPAIPAYNLPEYRQKAFKIGTGPYHILLTTGVHPDEHIGMHVFIAFINLILGTDTLGTNLRNKFTFYCYPNLNPQARSIGTARYELQTMQNANRIFSSDYNHIGMSSMLRNAWNLDLPATLDMNLDFHDNPFGNNYSAELLMWNAEEFYANVLAARQSRAGGQASIKFEQNYDAPNSIRDWAKVSRGARVAVTVEHGYIYALGPSDWANWALDVANGLYATYASNPPKAEAFTDLQTLVTTGVVVTRESGTNDYIVTGTNVSPKFSILVPANTTMEITFEFTATGSANTYLRTGTNPAMTAGTVDLSGNLRDYPQKFTRDITAGASPLYVGIATNMSGTTRVLRLSARSRQRVIPAGAF